MNGSMLLTTLGLVALVNLIHPTSAASWIYENDDGEVEGRFFFLFKRNNNKNSIPPGTTTNTHELGKPQKRCTSLFSSSTCNNHIAIIQNKNDNLRKGAKTLLLIYSGMMLLGKLALPSFFCSVATIKLIQQSEYYVDRSYAFQNINWTIVSWVSLAFSSGATISNWMVDQLEKAAISTSAVDLERKSNMVILPALRIGARSIELVGGTVVLFLLFLSL